MAWKLSPVISIIGPEGAGKSTTVAAISALFSEQKIPHAVIFMGRGKGNIIPLNKFSPKREEKSGMSTPLPKTTLKKKIVYTLGAGALTLDFCLRYLFHIFPQRLRKKIVITDRYTTDLYNMHHVPLWVRKAGIALFPKPAITFYLYNDIATLHQRKGRNLHDLQWQIQNYAVLSTLYEAIALKTDHKADTLAAITAHLKSKLAFFSAPQF